MTAMKSSVMPRANQFLAQIRISSRRKAMRPAAILDASPSNPKKMRRDPIRLDPK